MFIQLPPAEILLVSNTRLARLAPVKQRSQRLLRIKNGNQCLKIIRNQVETAKHEHINNRRRTEDVVNRVMVRNKPSDWFTLTLTVMHQSNGISAMLLNKQRFHHRVMELV